MDLSEFRSRGHELVDWMADFLEHVRELPVRSQVVPGEVRGKLSPQPPAQGESFDVIMKDFREIILPGMTHWQHPSFHAYFPGNSSPPSVLAEMLTATLGAQCMMWQTSPAAAELEEHVLDWLKEMLGFPGDWSGVIQDTASTASLCSILTARERAEGYRGNLAGLTGRNRYTVYASAETHSSIDKAVRIAGLGSDNLRKIEVDENFAMIPKQLEAAIAADREVGMSPLCAIATLGTTGSTAVDPIKAIGQICKRQGLWFHVDAAFSGTALLLEEKRWMSEGIELADTFVFNPHKWMFTNFDCSAYYVKDAAALVRTFEILPEYLKTGEGDRVKNYRDWGVPLGRRFRALKLWMVIRTYGVEGLREMVRGHIALAHWLKEQIESAADFELMAPVPVSLVCFRYHPAGIADEVELEDLNLRLLGRLNDSGRVYLTHTKLSGKYVLRMVTAQTQVTASDVERAWALIQEHARTM